MSEANSANTPLKCLNCGRSENDGPLVSLRYSGQAMYVCSGCMPTLIHKPEEVAGKLKTAGGQD